MELEADGLDEVVVGRRVGVPSGAQHYVDAAKKVGNPIHARQRHDLRLREAQRKLVFAQDALALGRILLVLVGSRWAWVFRLIGTAAPEALLENLVRDALEQLERLIAEDGPKALAAAEEVARAIESAKVESAPAPTVAALPEPSPPTPVLPPNGKARALGASPPRPRSRS